MTRPNFPVDVWMCGTIYVPANDQDCCRGWHDFSDGATECLVCGAGEDEASAPNATGLAKHHGLIPPPSGSMVAAFSAGEPVPPTPPATTAAGRKLIVPAYLLEESELMQLAEKAADVGKDRSDPLLVRLASDALSELDDRGLVGTAALAEARRTRDTGEAEPEPNGVRSTQMVEGKTNEA